MERGAWTDQRLDDKMQVIDRTFEMMRNELSGLRTDMREEMRGLRTDMREETRGLREDFTREMGAMRSELKGEMGAMRGELKGEMGGLRGDFNGLRSDFAALQRQLIQIGFGMVGVLLAAICALIVATV